MALQTTTNCIYYRSDRPLLRNFLKLDSGTVILAVKRVKRVKRGLNLSLSQRFDRDVALHKCFLAVKRVKRSIIVVKHVALHALHKRF